MAFQANDAEFRRIEREILDPFHKSLALFARDGADARLGSLAAFDGLALPSAIATMAGREPNASTRQVEKQFEDGLAQALRWLTGPGAEPTVSLKLVPGLLEDAANFLIHAGDYSSLADFHRLYGAGMVLAQVDVENRRVRFTYSSREQGFEAGMGFISSIDHELVRLKEAVKSAKIQPAKPIEYELRHGMVRLRQPESLATNDPNFQLPEAPSIIAADAELGGFSMADFSVFWRALVHWSAHCLGIYARVALSGKSQELCMPTQVIPLERFRNVLTKLSGLSPEKVRMITDRLSFDYRTKSPCIFQQPLLVGGGSVAWSPNLVIHSRADRNMLRLMARTPGLKHIADNLIGGRERFMVNSFGQRLQRYGWSYKLSQQVQHGGLRGEIDLLGYTRNQPNTVAVVEWKSILSVDEVHEVRAATMELICAQSQALRCVEILRRMSPDEKRSLYPFVPWGSITEYIPLVVTKDVEPNQAFDHSQVPCVCVDSLLAFGRASDSRSPGRLAAFARNRPWHQKYADLEDEFSEVKVGETTYELPMLAERLE